MQGCIASTILNNFIHIGKINILTIPNKAKQISGEHKAKVTHFCKIVKHRIMNACLTNWDAACQAENSVSQCRRV